MIEATAAAVEARIGRRLTAAEQHVDVLAIDELLNTAKDDLDAAIQAEQARLARALAQQRTDGLQVTDRMRRIIRRLREHGATHARRELASMGYSRRFAAPGDKKNPPPVPIPVGPTAPSLDDFEAVLAARLRRLTVKIERDALGGDISTVAVTAIERAVVKVLGARSIAADLVAPVFGSGLADTFEQHQNLVDAWQYSAVLDGGLCDPCAAHDGEIYQTLDALMEVLPDFSGNPECLGGDRCRCRAIPVPPAG